MIDAPNVMPQIKAVTGPPAPARKRVLIVEDSAVIRQMLEHIIGSDPRLEVVASVESGEAALRILNRISPDVISMDIRLPGMNGFETTQRIMAERPTPVVVISASVEDEDLKISMNALRAGALAVLEKPTGLSHRDYEAVSRNICTQLFIMSQVHVVRQRFPRVKLGTPLRPSPDAEVVRPVVPSAAPGSYRMVGLAASTGGPNAVVKLLGGLGAGFPLPVLLVQHISASFLNGFVNWLDGVTPLKVVRAANGVVPAPGHVYVAAEELHLTLQRGRLVLVDSPPVSSQKPSATVLFESMAASLGESALGIVLTGMGDDGARGLKAIRDAGGYTIGEDETTAVVFGMPAAAAQLGGLCQLLPLDDIPERMLALTGRTAARP